MSVGKQLKQKLAETNAFQEKHIEFLKEIEEFNNNKELKSEYERVLEALKESAKRL